MFSIVSLFFILTRLTYKSIVYGRDSFDLYILLLRLIALMSGRLCLLLVPVLRHMIRPQINFL